MEITCSAILFDSDGVLVDSHADGRRAWFQLAEEFDFALDDKWAIASSASRRWGRPGGRAPEFPFRTLSSQLKT